jgi:hypothetical protein
LGKFWTPKVDIAFYKTENGSLQIAKDGPVIALTAQDLAQKKVEIPINLALRNRDGTTLEVLEVQISYNKDLEIRSGGKARIDESNQLLIYEHNLGMLVSSDYYMPLQSLDTISVPFDFDERGSVGVTKDGIPLYALTLFGIPNGERAQKDIDLGITIYFKDRPPVKDRKRLRMFVVAGIQPVLPEFSKEVNADAADVYLFRHPPSGTVLAQWQSGQSPQDPLIQYKKVRVNGAIHQLIFVNGELRRLIADINGDGFIDFELFQLNTKNAMLLKVVPRKPIRMIDWKPGIDRSGV